MKLSRKLHQELEIFFQGFFNDKSLQLPEIEIYCGRAAKLITKTIGVHGITFRHHIFIKPDLIYRDALQHPCISKNLLAHEIAHTLQYQKLGAIKFLYEYVKSYFLTLWDGKKWDFASRIQAYLDIPFESEAREAGAQFVDWIVDKKRKAGR